VATPSSRSQQQPSAKGTLVLGAAVSVRRLRERGAIAADALEARLSGPALELLDQKINIAGWYPVQAFCELMDLHWEVGGRRDPQFMRDEGARSADRLFDSGIYQQLQFAEKAERVQHREDLARQSRLISSITGSLYNFLEISVLLDEKRPDELQICYANAALFNEALRISTEGFMNRINHRQNSTRRWTSERVAPDRVVFRMPLPGRLSGQS
jgi:hypothetical protein